MASPLSANAQRHGNWPSAYRPLTNCMYQFETLNLSLEEKMILNAIASDPHLKQQQMTELIHKSIATVDKREAECLGWHSAIAKRRKGGGTPSARQGRKRFIAL